MVVVAVDTQIKTHVGINVRYVQTVIGMVGMSPLLFLFSEVFALGGNS